jgi:hypothetical protein
MEACTSKQPLSADEVATLPTAESLSVSGVESWGRTNAMDSYAGMARVGSGYVVHYVPTGTTAAALVSRATAAGISATPARYTLTELDNLTRAIAATAPLSAFDIFGDIANNVVVVRSRTIDQTAIVQFYSIWGADKVVVEIDNTTSYARL